MTVTKLPDFKSVFDSLPELYVILQPDLPAVKILGASQAYLAVIGKTERQVIGKDLFDILPDTSSLARQTGHGHLYHSIEQAVASQQPHTTGVMRYDIPSAGEGLELRYWQVTHYPVTDGSGRMSYIVQQVCDITDMVLTSEQQRISEQQIDEILATGLVGSWLWTDRDDLVTADKGLARMLGINEAEARQGLPLERFVSLIHVDDRNRVEQLIDKVFKKGSRFEAEFRTVDSRGVSHWVIARGRLTRDKAGHPVTFPGVMIDITDRKQAEEAVSESEARLRFMADAMPQLVWVVRPDGHHEYYNAQWYSYTGATPGTVGGDTWKEFFHPDDRKAADKRWHHCLQIGENYEMEYRLYHAPTGRYRWVIGRALPMKDAAGNIVKWYGTSTDIDDQKRSEQVQAFLSEATKALSLSLDYRKTLQQVAEMCVPEIADWCSVDLYDEQKGFEQVVVAHSDPTKVSLAIEHRRRNPPTDEARSGVAKVVKTGQPEFYPVITNNMLEEYIKDPDQLAFMTSLNLHAIIIAPLTIRDKPAGAISFVSADSGRYYEEDDLRMAEELASRISLAMTNASLYSASLHELHSRQQLEEELIKEKQNLEQRVQERTSQLQLTNQGLRDEIKRRREAEKALKIFSKELARSNQELQDFAYVSSHDLQEPLRKIRAFGDLLKNEYGDRLGEGGEYIERMQNAAIRMSKLIEDLLDFSRVSSKPVALRPVDLTQIVRDVVSDLEASITEAGAKLTVGDLPMVVANETHMRQLFQNLIGNALKFRQPDTSPTIKISARTTDEEVVIRVSDNGIGFSKAYAEKIFAVFQRLHNKDAYDGTGIGLAVCRKIVERYSGTITADSEINKGTTFTVKLPKVKEQKSGK